VAENHLCFGRVNPFAESHQFVVHLNFAKNGFSEAERFCYFPPFSAKYF